VSICIPTYNGAPYLRECLDSAVGQSYENVEVLIVDDCSSDETAAIANEYAERDRRVRVVVNASRRGLVDNWNRCVELARGQWVKFLFQDDFIERTCVERMLTAAREAGVPFVACLRSILFEDVSVEIRQYYSRYTKEYSVREVFCGGTRADPSQFCSAILDHMTQNIIGEPTAVLLGRRVFAEFGGFNRDLVSLCDLEYWTRVGANMGLAVVPEVLATFRAHSRNATSVNLREHQYRLATLDPLILLHQFVYHPAFSSLRDAAKRREPPVELQRAFGRLAVRAREEAVAAHRGLRASRDWTEWCDLVSRYPRIKTSMPTIRARAADARGSFLRRLARGQRPLQRVVASKRSEDRPL
jgi:glycosyltransferase involved in cell wall biosynthesis